MKKITSFDYYFKARIEPKIPLDELMPDIIESNRILIEKDISTSDSERILITKDNIYEYFDIQNFYVGFGLDCYFEVFDSVLMLNNYGHSSSTKSAFTSLTKKTGVDIRD